MIRIIYFSILVINSFSLIGQIPSGYYNSLNRKQTSSLKTELHNIICQDTTHYLSYGSGANHTWQGFYSTDRNTTNNLVIDMYSDSLRYFQTNYVSLDYPAFGQKIHIEHSVPKSWWGSHEWSAYKDLNHLYPADGSTNLSKNDYPLGVVSGTPTKNNGVSKIGPAVYNGYVGNVFEPADQYKGDFARTYFYMATAYEHYENIWENTKPENMMERNTYPTLKTWAIQLLLQWHRQDPVSQKELTRVENVYTIQHNRNPFIDHPELIEYIWGNKMGTVWNLTTSLNNTLDNPINLVLNGSQLYFILKSNDTTPLTVSIYSISGEKLFQTKSSTNQNIEIKNLSNGIYIFIISTMTQRLIVKQNIIPNHHN